MLSFHGTLRNCGESKGSPFARTVAARFRSHRGRHSFLPSKLKSMIPRNALSPFLAVVYVVLEYPRWFSGYLSICNFFRLTFVSRGNITISSSDKLKNMFLKPRSSHCWQYFIRFYIARESTTWLGKIYIFTERMVLKQNEISKNLARYR